MKKGEKVIKAIIVTGIAYAGITILVGIFLLMGDEPRIGVFIILFNTPLLFLGRHNLRKLKSHEPKT